MITFDLSEIGASEYFLSIKTSGEFNPALVSEITSSLVSQYIREIKPIPSFGTSGDTEFVYILSIKETNWN